MKKCKVCGTKTKILKGSANWCIHAAQGLRGVGGDAALFEPLFLKL